VTPDATRPPLGRRSSDKQIRQGSRRKDAAALDGGPELTAAAHHAVERNALRLLDALPHLDRLSAHDPAAVAASVRAWVTGADAASRLTGLGWRQRATTPGPAQAMRLSTLLYVARRCQPCRHRPRLGLDPSTLVPPLRLLGCPSCAAAAGRKHEVELAHDHTCDVCTAPADPLWPTALNLGATVALLHTGACCRDLITYGTEHQ